MAAEALLSAVLQQLVSATTVEARRQISLVGNVEKEVEKFTANFQAIKVVLVDAEGRQVKEEIVRFWLDQLKNISYDMEDVLDEWNTKMMKLQIKEAHENVDHRVSRNMKKVCFFLFTPCFSIKQVALRRHIALKMKEINENLDALAKQKDMFNFDVTRSNEKPKREKTSSLVDVSDICGRDLEKKTLVKMLLSTNSDPQQGLHVISIVGIGGIGKTTLAQLAYNDDEITKKFDHKVWVCVSDHFDKSKIAKAILKSFGRLTSYLTTLESSLREVTKYIVGKKIFLVLDDVWIEDYIEWEPLFKCLKDGHPQSKILVTTRIEIVARAMNSYSSDILNIKELSKDESWSFFKQLAFFDRPHEECEKLEEIGRKIVNKCKGLPLATKIMGGLLRQKKSREEWQLILNDEMWKLESFERGTFPPLLLSYNDLPPTIKSCFLYCAIFPKNWELDKSELIYSWMAHGYLPSNQNREMETIGEEYFEILANRFFFQDIKKDELRLYSKTTCKMHDIVHDVALLLTRKKSLTLEENDLEKSSMDFSLDKTRHLFFTMTNTKNSSSFRANCKKLRSLLIHNNLDSNEYDQFPFNMEQLTHLRTLRFECHLVKEIPREITKLIYLRFLHLIVDKVEALPDTLCELYNLQTLRVDGYNLKRLPLGMEKLIKLRHLLIPMCRDISCMPKGMEKLTCLQTLRDFYVNGSDDDNSACTLEALKNLNQLISLCIDGLGNVKDGSEIKKAQLWDKKKLVRLYLNFRENMAGQVNHETLLKACQPPPPNLEALAIYCYRGDILSPNWMMSLSTLKKLFIWSCENLECLPPLGNWPHLESLEISWMKSIKRVSDEFLGVESGGASSSLSSSSNIIFFPKLKSLVFSYMSNWEEWDYGIPRKDEEDITIMPHLRSLTFVHCPTLRVFPEELFQRMTLMELKIELSSQILKERYEEWRNRKK